MPGPTTAPPAPKPTDEDWPEESDLSTTTQPAPPAPPADGGSGDGQAAPAPGRAQNAHLWEESWDDDDTSDEFAAQLREELGRAGK